MFDYLQRLLGERGLAPHGYCLLWEPALIWTHVISDALIGAAYFSIPVVLARFLTRRRDVQFSWVIWMFAAFIMACGATHFFSILTLWVPAYGVEGLVKLVTAVVSVLTALALWPLLPRAIALPSPAQLQRVNDELRGIVDQRDTALAGLHQAIHDRQTIEEQLRQSQKMEAIGQLTSGVAHDFNNLLTVMIANLERADRWASDPERCRNVIRSALEGADRAAKLTDQLLSFARRQPLMNAMHDLNAIVLGMSDLLERTLGKGIALNLELASQLPLVCVDRNQTESAILNLIINSRDAMPDGGQLSVKTGLAEPGDTVFLEIADSGSGMDETVLEKAFDPFFTTKGIGKGTGLGLSQVYGFIKQSNGDIKISSTPGSGICVVINLPANSPDAQNTRNDGE